MFQIINDGEHTKIFIGELEIYIKGDFEIKKTSDVEITEYIKSLKDNYLNK